MKISEIGNGPLKNVGIKEGLIVTKIDGKDMNTFEDVQAALEGKSGNVMIEGVYTNGTRAYYGFAL
jgi:S1-C subfamily serine protease